MRTEGPSFAARVLAAVTRIPAGRVATYGDIAVLAGRPGAARAVGTIMRRCRTRGVPCHRIVAAGGRLGGFGSLPGLKRSLLVAEGVVVRGNRIRNFAAHRWTTPGSPIASPIPRPGNPTPRGPRLR